MAFDDSTILALVKRMTAATQQSEPIESLKTLSDPAFEDYLLKIAQGIALYSPSNYFHYVSKSMANILGYSVAQIYEMGPGIFQQLVSNKDKALVQEIVMKSQHALDLQSAFKTVRLSFDYHIVSGDGKVKRIYQHTIPGVGNFENEKFSLCILMDLTGFKNSQCLNYKVSYLTADESFENMESGMVAPPSPYPLTKREIEIMNLFASGQSTKEIASNLFISLATLKKHRQNILQKAKAKTMVGLVSNGLKEGWIKSL